MKNFRERWLLNTGDIIKAGEHSYIIIGEPLGVGGSAVLYPAKRSESELLYAIKECFPNDSERFVRKNGIITVISEDDREGEALLQFYREMFQKECAAGQSIRNFTGRSIGMWDMLTVQTITTGNQSYDASQGIYALLECMDGKGCSLSDILKECREEVSSLYPLRRGGLPDIYTTACIMEQVLRALQGVHEAGYLFGDIQKDNIFFMDSRLGEGEIGFGCLFDFGCARPLLEDGYTEEITDCKIFSTKGYTPPEVMHHNNGHLRLGKQVDVYSAGKLMLLCLLTEEQDLEESSISLRRLLQSYHGRRINCGGAKLDFVNHILEKALQIEPDKRYQDAKEMLVDILNLKKLTEPPKFRLSNHMSSPDYFVPGSREKELKALKESMQRGEHPMIWGYGGIGKTETAIELARRMDNSKGAYLVHFKNSMRETILSLQFSGYRFEPEKKGLSLEKREELEYQEKLHLLKDYYEDSIIIIDNFDNEEKTLNELRREKEFTDLIGLNLHLIFTTRYPVGRKEWEITELNREDLLNIMKYYLKSVSVSDEELYELIEVAGRHTLTVVLMAKTMEESWGMITPNMILEAFRNASISENCFPEIVSDQNRTYRQEQIYQHLKVLFNLSGMNDKEKKVLSYSVLLPQGGMDALLFLNCLKKEEQNCLYNLVAKGWLRKQEGNLLTIHPIICQVCREELQPNDEGCKDFLGNLWKKYDKAEYNFLRYVQMAECFSKSIEYLKDAKGVFSNCAGYLYSDIGDYQRGLECYKKVLKIQKEILPLNHLQIASTYNNIGWVYGDLGEYEKQLKYSKKALKIQEEILPLNHPEIASIYNNIGLAYGKLGEYEKQLEYSKKALKMEEENLPSNHFNIAVIYDSIGLAYGKLGEYEKQLEYLEKALRIMKKKLSPNHPKIAIMYNNIGLAYGDLDEYKKQLEYLKKGLKIQEEILPCNHLEIASTYNAIGYAYGKLEEYEKQLEHLKRGLKIQEEILPLNHPEIASTYNNIGLAYGKLNEYEKQLEYLKKGLKILEEKLPSDHPEIASTYNNIGLAYGDLCQYEKQLEYLKKGLKILEEKLPFDHPEIASTYNNIGLAYGKLNEYEKQLEYSKKSLKILEEKLPSDYLKIASTYNAIGYAYGKLSEYEKRLGYLEKGLSILEEKLPSDHLKIASTYNAIGFTYGKLGKYKKGIRYHQRALKIQKEILPSIHLDIAITYDWIGYAYGKLGEYEKKLECLEKMLKIREEILPPNHPHMVIIYNIIGYEYENLDEYKKGLEYYQKALKIQEEILPSNHSEIEITYYDIGRVYGKLGEYNKQLEYLKKVLKIKEENLSPIHSDLMELYYNISLIYAATKDLEQSYIWCEKAAVCGYVQGMVRLSNYLIDGKGCQQNYEEAFEWLNKAYTLGNSTATNNLGWMYLHGYGCKKDIWKAVEFFKVAANSETPCEAACKHLGEMYSGLEDTGGITLYDVEQALYYYQKAKDLGCEGLEDIINQLLLK